MNKNITLIGMAVALVAGGVAGYYGASYQYSGILNKAKAAFPSQPTMPFVSGTVQSISGNVITIKSNTAMNPFENLPEIRKVTVTSTTKIVKNSPKDPAVFQQEMADYQKSMQRAIPSKTSTSSPVAAPSVVTPPTLTTPPTPMNETVLKISDLKAGDMIMVDAGKDVKTLVSFDAVKISVVGSAPVMPAALPAGANGAVNTPPVPAGITGGTVPVGTLPPTPPVPAGIKTGTVPPSPAP